MEYVQCENVPESQQYLIHLTGAINLYVFQGIEILLTSGQSIDINMEYVS